MAVFGKSISMILLQKYPFYRLVLDTKMSNYDKKKYCFCIILLMVHLLYCFKILIYNVLLFDVNRSI